MNFYRSARFLTAFAISASLMLAAYAQSTLPATPATEAVAGTAANVVGTATAPTKAHHADVTYVGGLLTVTAYDSSLNQILRSIAHLTGMQIVGGVSDQRVFGHYGPADPTALLTTLLDGTETNVLIREAADDRPSELILTVRNGGPTPPNPSAPGFDDDQAGGPPSGDDAEAPVHTQPLQRARLLQNQPATPAGFSGQAMPLTPGLSKARVSNTLSRAQSTQTAQPQYADDAADNSDTPETQVPPSIPQPAHNVLGNPANTTPTASQLPVTNSQPTDTLPTPSTTTQTSQGIVDSVNPPPADTNTPVQPIGAPPLASATTTSTGDNGSDASNPNVNTTTPVSADPSATSQAPKTPEQIFQQLQQMQNKSPQQ